MKWKITNKEVIYNDKWKGLAKWRFNSGSGCDKDITIQISKDFVIVFGITDDNKILIIKQYFYAIEKHIYAFVAGIVDDGKTAEQIAESELLEEAGCVASEIISLGSFFYGKYITGKGHLFLAKGVKKIQEQNLGDCEDIEVSFVELNNLKKMLDDGEIAALPELATAYRALDYLKKCFSAKG